MRILGINGIHVWSWSKASFTDKLLDVLSDSYEVVDVRFPRMWAIFAYFNSAIDRRAQAIIDAYQPGDVIIAHSFGCLAVVHAMRKGGKFGKVFFFAAACEPDVDFPKDACTALYNIHSNTDTALKVGRHLPAHPFGALGLQGYVGADPRVVNVRADGMNHGSYVTGANLCRWANYVRARI